MDIGSPVRVLPVEELEAFLPNPILEEKRKQCSLCCALGVSGAFFISTTLFAFPFNGLAHGFSPKVVSSKPNASHPVSKSDYSASTASSSRFVVSEGGGMSASTREVIGGGWEYSTKALPKSLSRRSRYVHWAKFMADRYLFHSLPFACVAFTHHWLISEMMWSKGEKTLFAINTESLVINSAFWLLAAFSGRMIFRKLIIPRSQRARLAQFEYDRVQRIENRFIRPCLTGQLTKHFDVLQCGWILFVYGSAWAFLTFANEHVSQNNYSMFHTTLPVYGQLCAPRWREWRENEIRKKRLKTQNAAIARKMGEAADETMWGFQRSTRPSKVQ